MTNREVFQRDPVRSRLANDGVATVTESTTAAEIETLRYELEHFVCEGQYKQGIIRILESYLANLGSTHQPAVWVSGFFGSGKSHLLKMLRHLWVNTRFDSDGATARELARLPEDVNDLLRELDTVGRRCGGLHAAGGKLPAGGRDSLRLGVLSVIFATKGLPERLPQARFCLWLQSSGVYDQVKGIVDQSGASFERELRHMYVSPVLARALLEVYPDFAPNVKQVREAIREQFPDVEDIPTSEFVQIVRDVLSMDGGLPCTLIVLDEVQLAIGSSEERSYIVQEIAEAICKQLDSRVLLIGAGQTALSGDVPLLQRLRDRFTVSVELSDTDVETVTRRVVLAKRIDKRTAVERTVAAHAGEIDRQLVGTRIGPRSEDRNILVEDYPLLPVRRRFWEHVLRAVDTPGTSSQVRTQLRIVHDAVRDIAERPLGTVVPADVIFDHLQVALLQTGSLLREHDELIRKLDDGTPEGKLAKRLCALVFLIRKLPRDAGSDIGVRATADMLADLLVSDLADDGVVLRRDIPSILDKLVDEGKLIKVDDEYSLTTRESMEWEREFRQRQIRWNNDTPGLSSIRTSLLKEAAEKAVGEVHLVHGKSRVPRKLAFHFGQERPQRTGAEIPVWVRSGWEESENIVLDDARAAGNDDPTIFVYLPKEYSEELMKAIIDYEAAKSTIDSMGTPSTAAGQEARKAMATRMDSARSRYDSIIKEVIGKARVFQGGGQVRFEESLHDRIRAAAEASLDRLFPQFVDADDNRWPTVLNRAKNGDETAMQAVGWSEVPEKHPVCAAILSMLGAGKRGRDIRGTLENAPYGWPRDAVDAALITLVRTGHIRAFDQATPVTHTQLDQSKISVVEFRPETTTIDAMGRLKLRKLFQAASLTCKPGEETLVADHFLTAMLDLAERAGGEPPLPKRPEARHIKELRSLSGNEQLAAILAKYETLLHEVQSWKALAELANERGKAWAKLQVLLQHAQSLPDAEDLRMQAAAVYSERRLLQESDPVKDITRGLVKLLRAAVRQAVRDLEIAYAIEMANLRENPDWQKLKPEQQRTILERYGLGSVPSVNVDGDDGLFQSLQEISLQTWKTKLDALPQQFSNVALAAARMLEPRTQRVKLSSPILRTEDDIKKWIAEAERELLSKLKDGPVVVS